VGGWATHAANGMGEEKTGEWEFTAFVRLKDFLERAQARAIPTIPSWMTEIQETVTWWNGELSVTISAYFG